MKTSLNHNEWHLIRELGIEVQFEKIDNSCLVKTSKGCLVAIPSEIKTWLYYL